MPAESDSRRYQIRQVLGRGGFGTVYRAQLHGSGGFTKEVALKVLHAELAASEDVVRRLRDEARMLGLLRHRAIVQVDALLRLEDRWAISMEYVEGASLRELLQRGPIPPSVALEVVEEVSAALDLAWRKEGPDGAPLRLLHRDIKPGNIQITPSGEVKLLDFGVARAEFGGREAETRSLIFGSVNYLAPERMDFEDTHQGDIYALGITLFEMLTGGSFGKASINPRKHVDKIAEQVERLHAEGHDRDVVALIERCLGYEPEDRPDARTLERACRDLRVRHRTPWMRDWAQQVVPAALNARIDEQDDWSGSVVRESLGSGADATMALGADAFLEPDEALEVPIPEAPQVPARRSPPSGDAGPRATREAGNTTTTHRRRRRWLWAMLVGVVMLIVALVGAAIAVPVMGLAAVWALLAQTGIWESSWHDTVVSDSIAVERQWVDPAAPGPERDRVKALLQRAREPENTRKTGLVESVDFETAIETAGRDGRFTPGEVADLERKFQAIIRQ